jgi:hypothetical protein
MKQIQFVKKNFVRVGTVRQEEGLYDLTRVKNPYLPNKYGVLRWKLWDQQTFTNGAGNLANTLNFFAIPYGQGTKTKYETNMQLIQQLPAPQKFKIMGIEILFAASNARADNQSFLNRYYWELTVGERPFAEGHAEDAPAGGGLTGYDVANNASLVTNGVPLTGNMFKTFVDPMQIGQEDAPGGTVTTTGYDGIDINTDERFFLTWRNNNTTFTPTVDFTIRVNLCGFLARQVQ